MNRSRFTESEMRFFLEQVDKGARIQDICEVIGISHATFYNWRRRLSHRHVMSDAQKEKLENENAVLKEIVRELEHDKNLLLAELKKRR